MGKFSSLQPQLRFSLVWFKTTRFVALHDKIFQLFSSKPHPQFLHNICWCYISTCIVVCHMLFVTGMASVTGITIFLIMHTFLTTSLQYTCTVQLLCHTLFVTGMASVTGITFFFNHNHMHAHKLCPINQFPIIIIILL